MKKSLKLILLIIGILLVIGAGIFITIKLTTKDNGKKEDNKKEETKILYTFTDPLNNKINIVYNELLDEKYIGVDLSRFDDKEDKLRKQIRGYVYKDSDYKKLNLSDNYNEAYNELLKKIRGIRGSGYSRENLRKALQKENIQNDVIEYVIDNANIDYNDQALMVVYKHLQSGHSKKSLDDKLTNEGFTEEEIEFALNEVGEIDYYEQALHDACFYRFYKKFDKEKTARYLRLENFTEEENEYAVNIVFEEIK